MEEPGKDQFVLTHVVRMAVEEHRLFEDGHLDPDKRTRLTQVRAQREQCRAPLRQRCALRETGSDRSRAHVRPADIAKKYVA